MGLEIITCLESDDQIIQVKLLNVGKNSFFIGDVFGIIADHHINIDMISQVVLDHEMRIDFTCQQEDQQNLNKAIEAIKEKHPRMEIYQSRNIAKIKLEGEAMKEEIERR